MMGNGCPKRVWWDRSHRSLLPTAALQQLVFFRGAAVPNGCDRAPVQKSYRSSNDECVYCPVAPFQPLAALKR